MEESIGNAIKAKFFELQKDKKIMTRIKALYSKTLELAKEEIKSNY